MGHGHVNIHTIHITGVRDIITVSIQLYLSTDITMLGIWDYIRRQFRKDILMDLLL